MAQRLAKTVHGPAARDNYAWIKGARRLCMAKRRATKTMHGSKMRGNKARDDYVLLKDARQ